MSLLASCASPATMTRLDATAEPDAVVNDLGALDASTDAAVDDDPARDLPSSDGAGDGGLLQMVRVDPLGVPAPGSECTRDASVRAGDPTIAPPRPIVPQSVSRVTSQRPSFRWALPTGTTGARVEVCADRCCTQVIQTLEAEGTTVRPTEALPPGVVYWRMFGQAAGGTGSRASYTWEFEVRRRDTPVDSSWGTIRDFTGDGYDDMLVFSGRGDIAAPATLYLVQGGPGAPQAARVVGTAPMAEKPWARTGDFNGDGRADLAYPPNRSTGRAIAAVYGANDGIRVAPQVEAPMDPRARLGTPSVADWNGDGYSDLVISIYILAEGDVLESALMIYRGSPGGLGSRPQVISHFGPPVSRRWVTTLGELGDLDGDGFGDVYVSDREFGRSGFGRFILHGSDGGALRADLIPDPPIGFGSEPYTDSVIPNPIGDLDGDGRADFILRPGFEETVLVYRNVRGFATPSFSLFEPRDAGGRVTGGAFGSKIVGGDLDGDGFTDLMISASETYVETLPGTTFPYNRGRMYVYFGQPTGVATDPIWFDRTRPTDPDDNPQAFAFDIASPGDLDGDGIDDAAIVDAIRGQVCYVPGSVSVVGAHLSGCPEYPDPWLVIL